MATKYERWKQEVMKAHVPTYFKACLLDASVGKVVRGQDSTARYSYYVPGHELGRHVGERVDDETYEELEKAGDDPDEVRKWLKKHMNHCFRLIPSNRRPLFIKGFIEGFEEAGG